MATDDRKEDETKPSDSSMSTREAGRMGGERVRELVKEGKEHEQAAGDSKSEEFGERRETSKRKKSDGEGES